MPPVRPLGATAPPYFVVPQRVGQSRAPPTGSTTAAQRSDSSGFSDSAEVSSRDSISEAPSSRSQSASSGLPVAATTS